MTVIQKTIGRLPVNLGDYDSTKSYGKKNRVLLYGCEWESKVENNTYAPALLNTTTGVITPDTTHWKLISGSYNTWLIDNGYKKVDAANVKDGNNTQHEINNVLANAVNTEKNRAEGVESGHNTRIVALETTVGSGGSVDNRISSTVAAETSRAQAAEEQLRTLYNNLQQSQPVPVTALPATGETGKIYRLAGTTSYADYMYAEGAPTTPIKMAEYNNAIDSYLFEGSENLITNDGITKGVKDLYYKDTLTEHGYFSTCLFTQNSLYIQSGHSGWNFRIQSYALNKGDKIFAQGSSSNVWYIFYLPTEPVASDTPRTDYTILATGSGEFERFFVAPQAGYYLVYYYATGWGQMLSAKGSIDYTDKEIQDKTLAKELALSPAYLPNTMATGCSFSGNTLHVGGSANYRINYVSVNRGDEVLVICGNVNDTYYVGAFFSTSEPNQSVTVTTLEYKKADALRYYVKAPDNGYVIAYAYASGGCEVTKALIPQDYTNYAIEENERPYPIYYIDYIKNKIKAFYDSNKNNGKQSDAFIFITDIHIPRNYMVSPRLIQGIMQRSVITKVFFGGDIPYVMLPSMDSMYDYWQTFQEFYNRINPLGTLFNIRGNHEWSNIDTSQGDQWVDLPKSETYATIMGKYSENLLIHSNDAVAYPCYYYLDNIHAKIRYIILDGSSASAIVEDNYAQIGWLKNVLNNTPEGYEVIIFSHVAVSNTVFGGALPDINGIIHDANNKVGDMSNCVCHVGIVMNGHSHYDFLNWDNGILNIVTNCDTYSGGAYYPGNDVTPTDRYYYGGTTKEQSFDICNIDFENNIADLIKIGFGPSRRIHLNSLSLGVGSTITLISTIGSVTWYSYNANSAFDAESLENTVVSVNENTGVVTGLVTGEAVVMAKTSDNNREFWRIIVS